ncbi:MAG: response regulator [Ignavibacteriaceae bacterium]
MLTGHALIVEDATIIARDLKRILQNIGISNSIIINEGRIAIELSKLDTPSIALLDIKLADGISGLEVAKELKKEDVPFIFISGFSDKKNKQLAQDLDPIGIIEKPFDESTLQNMIKDYFHN